MIMMTNVPCIEIDVVDRDNGIGRILQFVYIARRGMWVETQTINQRQCNHGRWPESDVGQDTVSIRTRSQCMQMLTVLTTL